jgi:hypothetical protein
MRINLKIVADKPSLASGRIFPRSICEEIVNRINNDTEPLFIVNRVGLTEDVDMSRAVGTVVKTSARIEESGEISAEVSFFLRQFALAQPFDAQKYPQVGTQDGGRSNAVGQLADAGGLKFMACGSGALSSDNKTVTEYSLKYIYTEPI